MMTLEMNGSAKRGIGGAVHDHPAIAVRISSQSRVSGAASSFFDILSVHFKSCVTHVKSFQIPSHTHQNLMFNSVKKQLMTVPPMFNLFKILLMRWTRFQIL